MKVEFNQIRNQIRKYRREDLLRRCFKYIESKGDQIFPIWDILIIMKWCYEHSEYSYPYKNLDENGFIKIRILVQDFNNGHISNFLKEGRIDQSMQIFHSQQFYLQTQVYLEVFALQLKIYESIKGKYNIQKSFFDKTGIHIKEFLLITQILWVMTRSKDTPENPLKYYGSVSDNILTLLNERFSTKVVNNYFKLTVLTHENAKERIIQFKRSLKNQELQLYGTSFFTLYPFNLFDNRFKVVHQSIFNYFANHFIYDFMKSNDENFTTEFGDRFEKYIEFSLQESGLEFQNENQIKNQLGLNKNLVDFYIPDENIFIECKAIEMQIYTLVNPTEDLLFSSLKDSILKAYYKQLLNVSKLLSPQKESWGIIITYKELVWSDFQKLHNLFGSKYEYLDNSFMPENNVFIIDVKTWNLIIYLLKLKKTSLLELLKLARNNNSDPITRKQLFHMHLDKFKIEQIKLSYLEKEIEELKI